MAVSDASQEGESGEGGGVDSDLRSVIAWFSGVMLCCGSEGLDGSHEMGRKAVKQREHSGRTRDFTGITGGQQLGSAARSPVRPPHAPALLLAELSR